MRYLIYRFLAGVEHAVARYLPAPLSRVVLRVLYWAAYAAPIGVERFTYPDGTTAKFLHYLLMSQPVPGGGAETMRYLAQCHLGDGDVVVDAGAWPGDFAVYAARKVGRRGHVVCFEPNPFNRRVLKNNLRLNGLKNVTVRPCGVWSSAGSVDLHVAGKHSSLDSVGSVGRRSGLCRVKASLTTIDDELEQLGLGKVVLVKMDVEGAEAEALKGCRRLMQSGSPGFAISCHDDPSDNGRISESVARIFEEAGYTYTVERVGGSMLYARRAY